MGPIIVSLSHLQINRLFTSTTIQQITFYQFTSYQFKNSKKCIFFLLVYPHENQAWMGLIFCDFHNFHPNKGPVYNNAIQCMYTY